MVDYWHKLPESPTLNVYAQAASQMLASYLARAAATKQTFEDIDALKKAIADNKVSFPRNQDLPPSLATSATELIEQLEKHDVTFALVKPGRGPQQNVVCKIKDGPTITAMYKLSGTRVREVTSKVEGEKKR